MTAAVRNLATFRKANDPQAIVEPIEKRWDQPTPKKCKTFIITAAQNATPLHKEFFAILEAIAAARGAQLLVIPLRYKNPTSTWLGSQKNMQWWDVPEQYLQNVRKQINSNLVLMADVKTQPTAKEPLSAYDAMSGGFSAILGHTKLHLKCIPTTGDKLARILTTTGACTVANYTNTKAGAIGEFHHSLSAALVELDGPLFHLRQLHYHSASRSVTDGVRARRWSIAHPGQYEVVEDKAPGALALIEGDSHVDFKDETVEKATRRLLAETDPEYSILHDVLDSYSCSPHHWGNIMNAIAKMRGDRANVRNEVDRAVAFVNQRAKARKVRVVDSNHDDMLTRWILKHDWKTDPVNADFYLATASAMVDDCRFTGKGTEFVDPFIHWLKMAAEGGDIAEAGESFILGGIELALHGDKGPNGARGSIRNLRRIGVKVVVGHSHTPGIDEGAYQTGTSSRLRLEYNGGPSSWMNAHCLLQWDNKRQLVFVIAGRYRSA